jgi:hypothetical protein
MVINVSLNASFDNMYAYGRKGTQEKVEEITYLLTELTPS